jgi:nicotinamide phosphoribosyltransferase
MVKDHLSVAWKATWARVGNKEVDIFKDPITDTGEKKSAKGKVFVRKENGEYKLFLEGECEMQTIYEDGKFFNRYKWETLKDDIQNLF